MSSSARTTRGSSPTASFRISGDRTAGRRSSAGSSSRTNSWAPWKPICAALIRKIETRSPLPAVRLRALRRLTDAGVNAGLIVAPVLPGITDDVPHLEALFGAAREAGARFVHAGPLRLYAAVRHRFLPLLGEHFPELQERYRRAYARTSGAPRDYAAALARRVKRLQRKYGFRVNDGMQDRYARRLAPPLAPVLARGS